MPPRNTNGSGSRFTAFLVFCLLLALWVLNSYLHIIPMVVWTLPEWSQDNTSLRTDAPGDQSRGSTTSYIPNTQSAGSDDVRPILSKPSENSQTSQTSPPLGIGPKQAILDYSPSETDFDRLEFFCPRRRSLCLQGKGSNGWFTPFKEDVFNVSELMFGTGIHPRFKVFRDWMHAKYDPMIPAKLEKNECTMVDESIIMLHAWYPHMLWEVWNRIATQLFQYQVLDRFLSKHHRFAIMNLHDTELTAVHDLLLSPFTHYPFVHLHSLMENQTKPLFKKYWSETLEYFELKWNHNLYDPDKVKPAYEPQTNDCTCFREMYWCGFDLNLTKDVKQLPSVFDYLGAHEFGEFSWDMARWYKWYYQQTFGPPPKSFVDAKTKPRVAFIQRKSWKRPWANLDQVVEDCRTQQSRFTCEVLIFEDMSHIETIWNMSLVDVLVGIHGSGLVNGIFMNERASLLEIIPVRAPSYADPEKGTIMTWIYGRVPQRHAFFPLKPNEQKHDLLRDWQKPFNLSWKRIAPFLNFMIDTPHDFCKHDVPQHLHKEGLRIARMEFNKKSALYPYRPTCNNFTHVNW